MKIEDINFLIPRDYKNKTGKPKKSARTPFWLKLDNSIEDIEIDKITNQEEMLNLEESLLEISKIGSELKKRINSSNLIKYKNAIRSFFKMVYKNAFLVSEEISSRSNILQKKYTIIKIVDEKLNKLAISIMQNQVEQFDILSKLEEIQGLLVNLLQ